MKVTTRKITDILTKIVKTLTIIIPLIQGISTIWKTQNNNK
jgi:hypothetical protein